ncbi:centrosomal protein of 95 kDa-like isoform X1 [Haliotis rufescens]|uniref:centrosomal protein of 95 kDa-like isoform X1 n=1 Tax=Haliotis rufescens TaxID=6454 RepID=UPI00201FAB00|nr:centrosomal protein of 95 kDa-like isoform X1 [Haliotis rufescens]XP_046366647.2 centrosomal protein of 95 kDa-like isoform X1 [Haliotis rufescens]XP_046366648.2 centrosomal protein of 95 kDa-like isoform X1 [Haliotis rufescens]
MDSFRGSPSELTEAGTVSLANRLLRQCNSSRVVRCVEDITSSVLVDLFTGFLAESPKGLITSPITQEDETHNCQVIIDQLAVNLHTSLSHIRGRSIVDGDAVVIQNLLEIIAMLADIILNKIDSDFSTDLDDTRNSGLFVPSHDVTDELSSREVRWDRPYGPTNGNLPTDKPAKITDFYSRHSPTDDEIASIPTRSPKPLVSQGTGPMSKKLYDKTSDLLERANNLLLRSQELNLAHGASSRRLSPPPTHVKQNTWVSPGRLDSTEELVQDAHRIQQRLDDTDGPLHKLYSRPHADLASSSTTGTFDHLGVRPKRRQDGPSTTVEASKDKSSGTVAQHRTITHHLYHHYPSYVSDFSASAPLPSKHQTPEKDRLRATVGPVDYTDRQTQARATSGVTKTTTTSSSATAGTLSSRPLAAKGLASSYTDLHSLVSQTAAYVRAAVRTSPIRSRLERDALTDYQTPLDRDLVRDYPTTSRLGYGDPITSTAPEAEDRHLAHDLNAAPKDVAATRRTEDVIRSRLDYSAVSPGAASRKVSFLDDRSYNSSDVSREKPSRSTRGQSDDIGTIRVDIQPKRRPAKSSTVPTRAGEKYGSYTDLGYLSDTELENGKQDDRLRRRFHRMIDSALTGEGRKPSVSNRKAKSVSKQVRFQGGKQKTASSSILSQPSKPKKQTRGVLLDTRKHLLKENKTQKKKTQILKQMYEEDLEDLEEEFQEQAARGRKEAKETENDFKKKVLKKNKVGDTRRPRVQQAIPKRSEVTIKVVPTKKPRTHKPAVSTKVRRHSSGAGTAKRAMSLTEDEDLMPVLLEEFPHLYLSEHTWHELWRRGISQIEQLTRTYEENKRKKSLAQEQVEGAEKRHEILTRMVQKQLEHSKRLQDIKDQRSQSASVKNKMHEKRMQSARARKYYNEYQVRMRSKMLKRRTKEEMIFKKLFDECLAIQKERIQEVRRYAREQRSNHAEQRSNEIQSMENYYQDQFSLLAERVARERTETEIREKAQQKVLGDMKKELRRRMEREIKDYQEQMFRDEDDAYFRQLDADRLRHGLHLAKFQARV